MYYSYVSRDTFKCQKNTPSSSLNRQPKSLFPSYSTSDEVYIEDDLGLMHDLRDRDAKYVDLAKVYDFRYKPEVWYGKKQLVCVTCCREKGSASSSFGGSSNSGSYGQQRPVTNPWVPAPRPTTTTRSTTRRPWTTTTRTTRRPWTTR